MMIKLEDIKLKKIDTGKWSYTDPASKRLFIVYDVTTKKQRALVVKKYYYILLEYKQDMMILSEKFTARTQIRRRIQELLTSN